MKRLNAGGILVIWALHFVIWALFVGAVGCVAWHFIHKFW